MTDSPNSEDETFMRIALDGALQGEGFVEPNPMVGCVLVRDGELLGRGHHEKFGGPHAEVMALRSLSPSKDARGATAYVTLEPCCHFGKTPPCADALIDAGVARVVVGVSDPFAKVDGGGLLRLAEAGIETRVGVLAEQAAELIQPFAKYVRTRTPWVIAKWAMTLDGKIATATGESQWITAERSRAEVHRLRGRVDAIITGMGTVIADDPMLTARPRGPRSQVRVIFCRSRVPSVDSKVVQSASESPVWLMVSDQIAEKQTGPLADRGIKIITLKTHDPSQMVSDALAVLGDASMTNVMVEGGGDLLGSFLSTDQIDECHVYVGAKIFGGKNAPGPVGGLGISLLCDAYQMTLRSVDSFDDDVRMVYRRLVEA